jgi:hypothetical protein
MKRHASNAFFMSIKSFAIFLRLWGQGVMVGITTAAVLLKGDYSDPQGVSVTLQGCKMRNAIHFAQDRMCMVKSHVLSEVILLR